MIIILNYSTEMKTFPNSFLSISVMSAVFSTPSSAQNNPSLEVVTAPVVVTATRTEKKLNEVPSSLVVITDALLEREAPRTLGDALLDIPNVSWNLRKVQFSHDLHSRLRFRTKLLI